VSAERLQFRYHRAVPPRRAARNLIRAARRHVRAAREPKRRIRLETDERRAQLLALARKAFSDRSYDEVSIDDLAREARISKGLLYHYFPTKRDLYVAGLSEIAEELVQRMMSVPDDLQPIERVRAGLDAYLDHVQQHARSFVSLMRGGIGSDPEVSAVIESVRTRLFERFLARSPFPPELADNPTIAIVIRGWMGFVEAASIDWCGNPRMSRPELVELLTKILVEILKVIAPATVR
jgi:AcrR family transcriptional regulator